MKKDKDNTESWQAAVSVGPSLPSFVPPAGTCVLSGAGVGHPSQMLTSELCFQGFPALEQFSLPLLKGFPAAHPGPQRGSLNAI